MQQVAEMRWRGLTQYTIFGSRGEAQDLMVSLNLTKLKYFIITELFNHINMQNRQGYPAYPMFVQNVRAFFKSISIFFEEIQFSSVSLEKGFSPPPFGLSGFKYSNFLTFQ